MQRYEVKTEAFGRALEMCSALSSTDTLVKPGRRTRCYDPTKGRRKQCIILVPHSFKTLAPPSLYFPGEMQRRGIPYTCSNRSEILMGDFDGQGDSYTANHSTDHLICGPIKLDDEWCVSCTDPESLLPFNTSPPLQGEEMDRHATKRAVKVLRFLPTREECELILERWRDSCRSQAR